jgi:hypothetical protein
VRICKGVENYSGIFGRYHYESLPINCTGAVPIGHSARSMVFEFLIPGLVALARIVWTSYARYLRKSASGTMSKESFAMASASLIWLVLCKTERKRLYYDHDVCLYT